MKKRNLIAVTCVVLASGLLYTLLKASFLEGGSGNPNNLPAPSAKEVSGEEDQAIEITSERQQIMGVKKADVALIPLHKVIRTVGRIEYDERKLVTVNAKVEGWIEQLHADYTGKYVKKGEPLAEAYSPELFAVQLEYLNLLKWKTEKGHRFQRNLEFRWGDRYGTSGQMITFDIDALIQVAKQRMQFWDIPEEQVKELEGKGEPMRTFTIRSPVTGSVVQKQAVRGKRFEVGEKLFDIADLSTLWVISDIYVYELPLIKVGQTAKISLSFFPAKEFSSKIDFIYPLLSGETRTARVRFVIPNPGGQLKPQMFTNTEIKIDLGKRLAIPEDAIIDTGTRQVVYVDKGKGHFEPREISLGLRTDGMVEVTKGLRAGEKVATAGNFLIDSEAKLKGIAQ